MEELNELCRALQVQAFALCQRAGYSWCAVEIDIRANLILYTCHAWKPGSTTPEGLVNWPMQIDSGEALLARLQEVLFPIAQTTPAHAE